MRTKDNPVQNVLPIEKTSIQERQVTVQVLTIGTRQVTQSLFNQLVSRSLVDEYTGELNGIIWGWVNLHKDCFYKNNEHFHAVWEKNGQLFKSFVVFPWTKPTVKLYVRSGEESNYMRLRQMANDLEDNYVNDGNLECVEEEIKELEINWRRSFQAIKDAGQLFIAVSGVWG